jgi:hypothetical protein
MVMNTRKLFVVAAFALSTTTAAADASPRTLSPDAPHRTATAIDALSRVSLVDRAWAQPTLPSEPTPIPPIAIRALELGNDFLGRYVKLASADIVGLQIDAPNRGVKVSVGGGKTGYAQLRVSGDIAMVDGAARIATRVRFGVANQTVSFRMPTVEVAPVSYRQERGVELRLPFVHRRF